MERGRTGERERPAKKRNGKKGKRGIPRDAAGAKAEEFRGTIII